MCIDDGRVVSNFVAQVCALSNLRSAFWTLVAQNETTTWKRVAVFNLWSEQASNFVSLIGTSQGTNDHLWWWKSNSELPICLRFGMFLHKVPLNSSETNRDSTQQKNLQLCLKVPHLELLQNMLDYPGRYFNMKYLDCALSRKLHGIFIKSMIIWVIKT
jgi:hypothetical protein